MNGSSTEVSNLKSSENSPHHPIDNSLLHQLPSINGEVQSSESSPKQPLSSLDILLELSTNQKFSLSESEGTLPSHIPSYSYNTLHPADPIRFVESKIQKGTEFGAIKLSLDGLHDTLAARYRHLNPDTLKLKTKRVVYNPPRNEIYKRLIFLKKLISLHDASEVPIPPVKQEPHSPEHKPTFMVLFNLSKPNSPAKPVFTPDGPKVVVSRSTTPLKLLPTPLPSALIDQGHLKPQPPKPTFSEIPSIDNQPIDLFLLYELVKSDGGYLNVFAQNQWASIANKLGYEEDLEATSATLADTYMKVLYPLELESFEPAAVDLAPETPPSKPENGLQTDIEAGQPVEPANKLQKLGAGAPLLLGSAEEFPRSIRAKTSKGILLNAPSQVVIKADPDFANEQRFLFGAALERYLSTRATYQLNNYLQWIASNMSRFTDSPSAVWPLRRITHRTMRQIIQKDLLYQIRLLEILGSLQNDSIEGGSNSTGSEPVILSIESLEAKLMGSIEGSTEVKEFGGHSRLLYDYGGSSRNMHPDNINHYDNVPGQSNGTIKLESASLSSSIKPEFGSDSVVHPFNLQNLPFLPNSILGALKDEDLDSKHLTAVFMNVGTTLSIENWKCEDHFTQHCDYLIAGAWKRWYFIPQLDFDKFESLVEEIVLSEARDYDKDKIEIVAASMNSDFPSHLSRDDLIVNALANIPSDNTQARLPLKSSKLKYIIDKKRKLAPRNLDYFITPAMLDKHNIKYYTTVQKPGEMIYKYPKTYSCSISFGLNISEHVNFASKSWLKYGMAAEQWLAKQSLLPNFLTFKLLVNLIHQFDAPSNSLLHFESDVHDELFKVYSDEVDAELESRQFVRRQIKAKDILVEEKFISEMDILSDIDFQSLYPTKVVLQVGASQVLSMSLSNFRAYLDELKADPKLPDLVKDSKVELHLFLPDEKLRSWRRLLQENSVDMDGWLEKYEESMASEDIVALRTYKLLLIEGQKTWAAISRLNCNYLDYIESNSQIPPESHFSFKIEKFNCCLHSLRQFVDESNTIVEQCQTILSLKHQQRIRNGAEALVQDYQDNEKHLNLLVDLCNIIPKLSFFAPELEQVSEFKNEIESFDRACRQLIDQNNVTSSEAADMINLGSSFGIRIPSLEFLIRLKNRAEWLKTYKTIVTGGDPFLGKKEIFLIPDLVNFLKLGAECLASSDRDKLATIDKYLAVGYEHDILVKQFIEQNQFLNGVDLVGLENIMTDMEERVKLAGEKRLFVYLETYQKLVDLKAQESKVKFLQSYHKSQHALSEVQQILQDIKSLPYSSRIDNIEEAVSLSQDWIRQVETYIDTIKVHETAANKPRSHKQACSPKLMYKLHLILDNCKKAFADFSVDSVEKGAPYAYYGGFEITENTQTTRYCLCRDVEEGAMIECDRCHEWFHFNCVSHLSPIGEKEDDKYTCPACLVLERYKMTYQVEYFGGKLPEKKLANLITYGSALRIQPTAELNLLKEIAAEGETFKLWCGSPCKSVPNEKIGLLVSELMCRKILGSPLTVHRMIEAYLNHLVNAHRMLPASKSAPSDNTAMTVVPETLIVSNSLEIPLATGISTSIGPSLGAASIGSSTVKPTNGDSSLDFYTSTGYSRSTVFSNAQIPMGVPDVVASTTPTYSGLQSFPAATQRFEVGKKNSSVSEASQNLNVPAASQITTIPATSQSSNVPGLLQINSVPKTKMSSEPVATKVFDITSNPVSKNPVTAAPSDSSIYTVPSDPLANTTNSRISPPQNETASLASEVSDTAIMDLEVSTMEKNLQNDCSLGAIAPQGISTGDNTPVVPSVLLSSITKQEIEKPSSAPLNIVPHISSFEKREDNELPKFQIDVSPQREGTPAAEQNVKESELSENESKIDTSKGTPPPSE